MRAGAVFGVIEAITPLIGWSLGTVAEGFITGVDHWIAFGLLGTVGLKMFWEGTKKARGLEDIKEAELAGGNRNLILTAIGTSVDAAAVGVTLAFLDVNIILVALAIGGTTFLLTTVGLMLGGLLGKKLGGWVEILGGLLLFAIGTNILLEHTGFLA